MNMIIVQYQRTSKEKSFKIIKETCEIVITP